MISKYSDTFYPLILSAAIAQLGESQTEDLKVPGSIPGRGNLEADISFTFTLRIYFAE